MSPVSVSAYFKNAITELLLRKPPQTLDHFTPTSLLTFLPEVAEHLIAYLKVETNFFRLNLWFGFKIFIYFVFFNIFMYLFLFSAANENCL